MIFKATWKVICVYVKVMFALNTKQISKLRILTKNSSCLFIRLLCLRIFIKNIARPSWYSWVHLIYFLDIIMFNKLPATKCPWTMIIIIPDSTHFIIKVRVTDSGTFYRLSVSFTWSHRFTLNNFAMATFFFHLEKLWIVHVADKMKPNIYTK